MIHGLELIGFLLLTDIMISLSVLFSFVDWVGTLLLLLWNHSVSMKSLGEQNILLSLKLM